MFNQDHFNKAVADMRNKQKEALEFKGSHKHWVLMSEANVLEQNVDRLLGQLADENNHG